MVFLTTSYSSEAEEISPGSGNEVLKNSLGRSGHIVSNQVVTVIKLYSIISGMLM